jgi:hypothetical protein
MRNIFAKLFLVLLLTSCAETLALLGPASSIAGGGNIAQSSLTSAASYGIKKQTGKTPLQHFSEYAEKNNPTGKKEKCVEFLKASSSEVCTIAKQKVAKIKSKIFKQSKIEDLAKKSPIVKR